MSAVKPIGAVERGAAGLAGSTAPAGLAAPDTGLLIVGHGTADAAGAETAAKFQTPLFLAASASAEFFADAALAPFEAVKVAVQTRPGFAKGLFDGMPKLVQAEGAGT